MLILLVNTYVITFARVQLLDAVRAPDGPRRDVRRRLTNMFKMRTMPQRLASERLSLENLRRDSADRVQRIASMLDWRIDIGRFRDIGRGSVKKIQSLNFLFTI